MSNNATSLSSGFQILSDCCPHAAHQNNIHRRCIIQSEIVDRRATERLSLAKNTFESQGNLAWQAGVACAQSSHAPDGWLSHVNMSLTCMFEHMKKINPHADVGARAGAQPEQVLQPSAAAPIMVSDSLPVESDSLPVESVAVEEGAAPPNRFQRSLTGRLTLGSKGKPSKGKPASSPTAASQQLPSPSTGGFDEADGASSCADTQLIDDTQLPNSREKLDMLKAKLPLRDLMSGAKLGRQERNVRQYLGNNSLDPQDAKLLRNYLKLALSAQTLIAIMFVSVHAKCVCVCACGNPCVRKCFPIVF